MADKKKVNSIGGLGGLLKNDIFSYPVAIQQQHNVYISGVIGEVEDHMPQIEFIRTAPASDVIRLIINTPGGHVNTMLSYIQAIKETKAKVVAHAEGQVASAGTSIFLAAHEHTVSEYTTFMFHNVQYGTGGDAYNINRQVSHYNKVFDRMITGFYKDFLTEEEIKIIKEGGEVYLDDVDVSDRLPKLYAAREEEIMKNCDCDVCKSIREAEEKGYYEFKLSTNNSIQIPSSGDIPSDLIEQFTIEEWREIADILGVEYSKKDSRKRIHSKIVNTIKESEPKAE